MALDRDDDDWDVDPDRPVPPPGQDALPCEDDEPMESQRHVVQMHLLIDTLADAWAERRDFFVGGNMFVYFSDLQAQGKKKFRGPDVFVVRGTERKPRKSWVVWEEARYPDVVIELLSKTTEHVDRGEKMRVYACPSSPLRPRDARLRGPSRPSSRGAGEMRELQVLGRNSRLTLLMQ